jgi:hypothetical protein
MIARRLMIMVLLVTLFAMGFAAVVEETSRNRTARVGTFSSCAFSLDNDCFGTHTQRRER